MSKVFACLCALMLVVSVGASAEVVSFVAVDSQETAGVVSYTANLTGGYTLGSIDWDGIAYVLAPGTYGSELKCDLSGPLGAVTLTLGTGTSYADGTNFTGSDMTFVGLDPAGVWTFDFYESYNDGGAGSGPDATWDPINFDFAEPVVMDACFVADSQAAMGIMSYSATITGGYALGSIDWDGLAYVLATGTYGSELKCDVSGPLGAVTLTLGTGTSYADGTNFIGSDATLAGGDPAGVWTFDFYESYDDGADGLPDANWNDICITFAPVDPCTGPNDCASVELIGAGITSGDTTDCADTFPSYNLWSWSAAGNDHVYAIEIPCPGTEVCVTYTPLGTQDGIIALSNECVDGPVTAVAGADDTLSGDPEAFCYLTTGSDAAMMYIYVDTYGAGTAGAYDLEVVINGPVVNDTCDTAFDVTGGGTFYGTTVCAANDYDGNGCIPYASTAPDAAYMITVNDGDTVDLVYTPIDSYDPSFYVVGDCGDIVGTCVAGADAGFTGDPEFISTTFECGGTYYIVCDAWSTGQGEFSLDVVVTPAVPVDTFDLTILCDPDPLVLPTTTKLRVYVTNTTDAFRQFCGSVGVTLCNGQYRSNIRAGNMVLAGGATQFLGWGQVLPAYPATCNCTLVFDVEATDCTPCTDTAGVPAGWVETATCGITTVCD